MARGNSIRNESGIYIIESIIHPDRCYIGSAIGIGQRWYQHLKLLKQNKHHSIILQNHFNKYGETDLKLSVLHKCSREDLITYEQHFINTNNPYFNICRIVERPNSGLKRSEEAKQKMRDAWKNRYPIPKEYYQKMLENKPSKPTLGKHWKVKEEYNIERSIKMIGNRRGLGNRSCTGRFGKDANRSITISQYDLSNNFLGDFASATEASCITKISRSSINNNLTGRSNTAGGFIWKYKQSKLPLT